LWGTEEWQTSTLLPIRAFAREPLIPQRQAPLTEESARFACLANVSLNQAAQPSMKHVCDAITRYGFQLGHAGVHAEITDADLFPVMSIHQLYKTIVDGDAARLRVLLSRFKDGFCHLSIDASIVHRNSVLDIIPLRTAANEPSADYFLLDSMSVIESTFEFYSSTVGVATERLAHDRIHIRSIVGDG
jgi:hypothetical protein